MEKALQLAEGIDALNDKVGRLAGWLTLIMVCIGAYNAIVRYLGKGFNIHLSSNAYLELQWYLFSAVFLLGAAYTLRHNAHVRVDVLFSRLPLRTQAWINLGGALFFLIPFCVVMCWVSWFPIYNSWAILEMSPDPGGLPRYPIKTLIPVAFILLALQGLANMIKDWAFLKGYPVRPTETYQPGDQ